MYRHARVLDLVSKLGERKAQVFETLTGRFREVFASLPLAGFRPNHFQNQRFFRTGPPNRSSSQSTSHSSSDSTSHSFVLFLLCFAFALLCFCLFCFVFALLCCCFDFALRCVCFVLLCFSKIDSKMIPK